MNGYMIAFLVYYSFSMGGRAVYRWLDGSGTITVTLSVLFVGPAITLTLLYMGGAFSE